MSNYDVFIIGGGINGCGIARDAAGRGLVTGLAEMGDLAQGTSSASTKLIHGGLRYLEHYEFSLVREALAEREVLMAIAPHIVKPLRFVLPHVPAMRPKWLLRLGLFLYDHLARRVTLPGSRSLDLRKDRVGMPLEPHVTAGFEYSDCRVDDARLVVLNARDAARHGADILTRTKVMSARRENGRWELALLDGNGVQRSVSTRMLINAAGPWVDIAGARIESVDHQRRIRLVQGAHIVTRKLFDHDHAYMFQNPDKRIVFAIPYEQDFTLIGTTDTEFDSDPAEAHTSQEETAYLIAAVNGFFSTKVSEADVVWRFAGVRALVDAAGGKAQAASREYRLDVETDGGAAPLLTVLGGKITSYRTLAQDIMAELAVVAPDEERLRKPAWTGAQPLPGGDQSAAQLAQLMGELLEQYRWAKAGLLERWISQFGSETGDICHFCEQTGGLGYHFGHGFFEAEARWLMQHEWARTAEDILWRRTKLGLRFSDAEAGRLNIWMSDNNVEA